MKRIHRPEMGEVDNIFVCNKAKGQISKLVLQENKAHQSTRMFAYQGEWNACFRKIWRALFSCNTRFEICPFVLLPTYYYMWLLHSKLKGHDASKWFLPNFAFTIKRINFCLSWNHQKTIGFLMNSEVIQVSKIDSLKFDSCNGRSEIWRGTLNRFARHKYFLKHFFKIIFSHWNCAQMNERTLLRKKFFKGKKIFFINISES